MRDALLRLGYPCEIHQLPDSTRTAREAAEAVGCRVAQIAKTLVFRGAESGRALIVIASGANRVEEAKLAELAGEPVEKARADFVREQTGFAIGGVPPVGHARPAKIWIDPDLLTFDEVWAAGGTPHTVFPLDPSQLAALTGGVVAEVV